MQIIKNTTEFQLEQHTAVIIGKFDGMHLGHQILLKEILQQKENGMQAVVFTFDPPPEVLFGKRQQKELMSKEEKRNYFQRVGIDVLIEYPLNKVTASISPEDFIRKILCEQMKTKFIAAGDDLSFGNGGKGNCEMLSQHSRKHHYDIKIIPKVCIDEIIVSSSTVRERVTIGDMIGANKLLGSPYFVRGEVKHGKKLGRTIGMPTANMIPPREKLLPPSGVYFSNVIVDGNMYKGITNIGVNPTVEEKSEKSVETYLYDFEGDLYEKKILVELLFFHRAERKFQNLEELKEQIRNDIETRKEFLSMYKEV